MLLALVFLAAYLLGSLSGSLLLGKLRGVDIRTQGSGNAGGTNAFRTQGIKFALGVVLIDVGKGVLAAWLAQHFLPDHNSAAFLAVAAAIIGHIWPVFHGFRGGKGAATLVGGLGVIWPYGLWLFLTVWILCLLLTGYVGLSTILAAISLLVSAYFFNSDLLHALFASTMAILIAFSHRNNVRRLLAGTESRFEKARLLGRLLFANRE